MATISQDKMQRIAEINKWYEEEIARLQAEEDARAERYYNCEDDYSYGGICSQLNYQQRDKARAERDRAIEIILNDGYYMEKREFNVLYSLTTGLKVENARIVNGKFGKCWMIGDGEKFIGIPKKQDTLVKKGYEMFLFKQIIKVNAKTKERTILSTEKVCTTEIVY